MGGGGEGRGGGRWGGGYWISLGVHSELCVQKNRLQARARRWFVRVIATREEKLCAQWN